MKPILPSLSNPFPDDQCDLGNEVDLYESQICEILSNIRKPGDIRAAPKIAIIGPTFFSRHKIAESLPREISVLVKTINFSNEHNEIKQIKPFFEENVIHICEECQYLYERRPHGFDTLRMFLSQLVTSSRQIITTWNQYSWNFLSGFLHIERWFPLVITLPALSLSELQEYLLSTENENFRYFVDIKLDNSLEFVRNDFFMDISSLNLSFSLPYVTIRRRFGPYIPLFADKKSLPEDIIFRELFRLSMGEPGIAFELFKKVIHDDEIRFSELPKSATIPVLSAIEVYILTLILMYEFPFYSRLYHSVHDKAILNSSLYRLVSAGLVMRIEDAWSITPEGFAPVVSYLTQRRMIW